MVKNIIGLDIGTHTIKSVYTAVGKEDYTLLSAGYIPTPREIMEMTKSDEKIISESVNRLMHDMKVSSIDVSASLPSSLAVTRIVEIPVMTENEIFSSIQWEAEQFIPHPLNTVQLDYAVLEKDEKSMKILVVAAPINLIEKYTNIITSAGLNPVSLETEILSDCRIIVENYDNLNNMIVLNLGASTTEISLIHKKTVIYTKSHPIGGIALTRAIADDFSMEISQAEEYKRTYGVDKNKLEGKVAKVLEPYMSSLTKEIEKITIFYKEKYPKENIETIVLTGGGAALPGLLMLFTGNLGFDCQISNPFSCMKVDSNILPIVSQNAPLYSTAAGLSIKAGEIK